MYVQGNALSTDDPSLSSSLVDRVPKESVEGSGILERSNVIRGGHAECWCRVFRLSPAAISCHHKLRGLGTLADRSLNTSGKGLRAPRNRRISSRMKGSE